jgi:RsiW-degrading membrane proteinase PrsW (M82 family)
MLSPMGVAGVPPTSDGRGWIKWVVVAAAAPLVVLLAICNLVMLASNVPHPVALVLSMLAAVVPAVVYVIIVLQLDRYETEPAPVLAAAFLWGALVATIVSYLLNTGVGRLIARYTEGEIARLITAGLVAPIVEESAKGIALLLLVLVLRREFDNALDGVVYGGLIGLGFAMTENVLYFGRFYSQEGIIGLASLFYMRAILGGFGHAIYTATTGAGVGFAAGSSNLVIKLTAPFVGYLLAIAQHSAWNALAASFILPMLSGALANNVLLGLFVVSPIVSFIFIAPGLLTLLTIAALAGRREARAIRDFLGPEVQAGFLTPDEYRVLCSSWRRLMEEWRALFLRGPGAWLAARQMHDLATELAFRRWHLSRGETLKGEQKRYSDDEYRRRILAARARLAPPVAVRGTA